MVKFSALPSTIVWIIVVPVFFFTANFTEGKNHRSDAPDHRPRERSEKRRSQSANTTTKGLITLTNFNGPLISQDAESSADDSLLNSKHIRVKRGLRYSDKLGKIHGGDFREEVKSSFKADDEPNVRNEVAGVYPYLVDDPPNPTSAAELIREKRLDYEMLSPRSYLKSESEINSVNTAHEDHDDHEQNKEWNGEGYHMFDRKNPDPVFFESFSKYENSLQGSSLRNPPELSGSYPQSGIKDKVSELSKDASGFLNFVTNPTSADNAQPNHSENHSPIDRQNREISNSGTNGMGNGSHQKRRKKRYSQVRGRTTRKGRTTLSGKGQKLKHRKNHKKKRKKLKGPAATKHEERGAAEIYGAPIINGDSNFVSKIRKEHDASNKRETSRLVDELHVEAHVEKRDSGDVRSEIDINKREISANYRANNETQLSRDKRTIGDEKSSAASEVSNDEETAVGKRADSRRAECGKEKWRYYDDVSEPDLQTQRDYIEMKPDPVDKLRKERAAKSLRQIEHLVEELTGKVNELETYVNGADNDQERKKRGKNIAEVEDLSNWTRSAEGAGLRNLTKDRGAARVCADEADAKSKLEFETSGRGDETNERAAGSQAAQKRSTRILRRRQTSKKSRIKKRKSHRKWDRWTDWSSCSVTCGKGRQIRWRHCIHDCTSAETEMEEKSCQLPACSPGKFLGIF